jgi:MoaA/NifB/PqqE/SkfB family radical SAM enzyme
MTALASRRFRPSWRQRKSAAFDLARNSTARRTIEFPLWGREVSVYANANLSIYSGQRCNAACPFCVEELRPASRGLNLEAQRVVEGDDGRYFAALERTLAALRPLAPTIAMTGGEPSKDPRLPRILRLARSFAAPKRTLTTNGSGLLDVREGCRVIDWITSAAFDHLNISLADPDPARNARAMRLAGGLSTGQLAEVVRRAAEGGVRVRLSCVLRKSGVADLGGVLEYLAFARSVGVDNVIFRQLMKTDPATHAENHVVRYCDRERAPLAPILDRIAGDGRFAFVRQVMGYYYYVEVWRHEGMDVVFEEADLAHLEAVKRRDPGTIHELVFHPNGRLASTWQPWDGVIGPPAGEE